MSIAPPMAGPGRRADAEILHMRVAAANQRELDIVVTLLRRHEWQEDAGPAPVDMDRADP